MLWNESRSISKKVWKWRFMDKNSWYYGKKITTDYSKKDAEFLKVLIVLKDKITKK